MADILRAKAIGVLKTGHETAKVGSLMKMAIKLPRSAVSWPFLIGAYWSPKLKIEGVCWQMKFYCLLRIVMNDRRHKTEIQAMLAAIYNHYRARVSARSHPGSPAFFVCSLGFASFPAVRF